MSTKQEIFNQFQGIVNASSQVCYRILEENNWDLEKSVTAFYESKSTEKETPPQDQKNLGNSDKKKGKSTYFAGGEKSGMLVESNDDDEDDIVKSIFEKASKEDRPAEIKESKKETKAFTGVGFTLGSTPESSRPVQPPSSSLPTPAQQQPVTLTFWRNGFQINDQPLRSYTSPENEEFLRYLDKGEVPPELRSGAQNVEVNLKDKKGEDYIPPKPKIVPFTGTGHSLSSSTTSTSTSTSTTNNNNNNNDKPTTSFEVDPNKPQTTIQIRFHDSTKAVLKLNLDHTVQDIRNFVAASKPGKSFALMTTFPRATLTNNSQTISEAGLQNAVVIQNLC